MPAFTIIARDASSRARAGVLSTAHGDVRTPAFTPLATKATVKGLLPEEVAALGYDMVLGNTFHLLLRPGPELIERFGGLGPFMGWPGPTITDSGGFQVFSMGHGTVAEEIKGRARGRPGEREGAILEIGESGRAVPLLRGRPHPLPLPGGLDGHAGRPALGRRARVRRVHARSTSIATTPSARPSAPIAGSIAACAGTPSTAPTSSSSTGSCRAASTRTCAASPPSSSARAPATASRSAARSARRRRRCTRSSPGPPSELGGELEARPRHLLGIGEVDDLIAGVELGIDTFDCAMPTRLGRHGTALVPDPDARWRLDLTKAGVRESEAPLLEGCPCPACSKGFSRAYLSYLARAGELTGTRLITMHNLAFLARLMGDLRQGILDGGLDDVARAWRAGEFHPK